MLEVMSGSERDVLAFRARGVLSRGDYRDVLIPHVEAALKGADRIRVLLFMDETFRGWDARAAWLNTRLDIRHRRRFDKVAIVGAPAWKEWCARLAGLLITGEIRTFAREQVSDAWTWLRG